VSLLGLVAYCIATILFPLAGRRFEPSLNLPLVLGGYSAILVIYKFLYVEKVEFDWDSDWRARFSEAIKVGFIITFMVAFAERILFIWSRGDISTVPSLFASESLIQPVVSMAYNLYLYVNAGDLTFFITLVGLFLLSMQSLAFVTNSPTHALDTLNRFGQRICDEAQRLESMIEKTHFNRNFLKECLEVGYVRKSEEKGKRGANCGGTVNLSAKSALERSGWLIQLSIQNFFLISVTTNLIVLVLVSRFSEGARDDSGQLLWNTLFTPFLVTSFLWFLSVLRLKSLVGKFFCLVVLLLFGLFAVRVATLLFSTGSTMLWVHILNLAVLRLSRYVVDRYRNRVPEPFLTLKFNKSSSFCWRETWTNGVNKPQEIEEYFWLLEERSPLKRSSSRFESRLKLSWNWIASNLMGLDYLMEAFRCNELFEKLEKLENNERTYLDASLRTSNN